MPIFVGTSGIIPELLNKWHNFWTYIIYITNIYPMQIIIWVISKNESLSNIFREQHEHFLGPFGAIFIWVISKNDF